MLTLGLTWTVAAAAEEEEGAEAVERKKHFSQIDFAGISSTSPAVTASRNTLISTP